MIQKSKKGGRPMHSIKLINKADNWVKTVCTRDTSISEINAQAEWIWGLLNKKEKKVHRVL